MTRDEFRKFIVAGKTYYWVHVEGRLEAVPYEGSQLQMLDWAVAP